MDRIIDFSEENLVLLCRVSEISGFDYQRCINISLSLFDTLLEIGHKDIFEKNMPKLHDNKIPPSSPPIPPLSPISKIFNNLNIKNNKNNHPYVASEEIEHDKGLKKLVKSKKPKSIKTPPPADWVAASDAGKIPEQGLIDYAENNGFGYHQAVEMFIDFINFQLKKGNKWVKWERAWYDWVRRQKKFNMSDLASNHGTIAQFKKI